MWVGLWLTWKTMLYCHSCFGKSRACGPAWWDWAECYVGPMSTSNRPFYLLGTYREGLSNQYNQLLSNLCFYFLVFKLKINVWKKNNYVRENNNYTLKIVNNTTSKLLYQGTYHIWINLSNHENYLVLKELGELNFGSSL